MQGWALLGHYEDPWCLWMRENWLSFPGPSCKLQFSTKMTAERRSGIVYMCSCWGGKNNRKRWKNGWKKNLFLSSKSLENLDLAIFLTTLARGTTDVPKLELRAATCSSTVELANKIAPKSAQNQPKKLKIGARIRALSSTPSTLGFLGLMNHLGGKS